MHRADGMMVEADDSVWIRGASPATGYQVFRVDATGREVERISYPDSFAPGEMGVRFAGDLMVISGISARDSSNVVQVGMVGGVVRWRLETPSDHAFSLYTPQGRVWYQDRDALTLTLYENGVPILSAPNELAPSLEIVAEDGSFVGRGSDGTRTSIRRILPDGTIAWTLPVEQPFAYMTLDVDGRLYLYGSGYVIAVQTDALPPGVRGCWQFRCSPRGDDRIEALP